MKGKIGQLFAPTALKYYRRSHADLVRACITALIAHYEAKDEFVWPIRFRRALKGEETSCDI